MIFTIAPDIQYEYLGDSTMDRWYLNKTILNSLRNTADGEDYVVKAKEFSRLNSVATLVGDISGEHKYDFSDVYDIPNSYKHRLKQLSCLFRQPSGAKKASKYISNASDFNKYFALNKSCGEYSAKASTKYTRDIYKSLRRNVPKTSEDKNKINVFVSKDPLLNRIYLLENPTITPDHILAILCIAGIDFELPGVFCEEPDVLHEIRERHSDDRDEYVFYLKEFIQGCYERLADGYYGDAWDYANIVTNQKISVLAHKYEKSILSGDRNLIKHVLTSATEGVPSIATSLEKGAGSITRQVGIDTLKFLSKGLSKRVAEEKATDKFPMASYIFKLKKKLVNN